MNLHLQKLGESGGYRIAYQSSTPSTFPVQHHLPSSQQSPLPDVASLVVDSSASFTDADPQSTLAVSSHELNSVSSVQQGSIKSSMQRKKTKLKNGENSEGLSLVASALQNAFQQEKNFSYGTGIQVTYLLNTLSPLHQIQATQEILQIIQKYIENEKK